MADARDLKSLGEDPYRFESGHKHQRFKLGLKRSENGSLAQVPLPFFGSPYAVAFRSVYVTGERNSDAIAPRYSCISPSPIGNRYSVAALRFAPYESGHKHQRRKSRPFGENI